MSDLNRGLEIIQTRISILEKELDALRAVVKVCSLGGIHIQKQVNTSGAGAVIAGVGAGARKEYQQEQQSLTY